MKMFLLDTNLLIALLWPAQVHHQRAQRWFRASPRSWATCPITQCGFVRIISNPMFSRDALAPAAAAEYLAANVSHARHRFLADKVTLLEALAGADVRLQGHQQTTDAYLLGLAVHQKARLATLDKSISALLPEGARHHTALEVVSHA